MVGVPRSKGCRTCIQRKVKCDQVHPVCGNCTKGNRKCLGYTQGIKFQDEGPRLREKYKEQSTYTVEVGPDGKLHCPSTAPELEEPYLINPEDVHWSATGLEVTKQDKVTALSFVEGKMNMYLNLVSSEQMIPERQHELLFFRNLEHVTKCDSVLGQPPLFSPSLMQNQLLQEFSASVAPYRQDFLPAAMKAHATWMKHLPNLTGSDLLLDTAVKAVTLVHIGRLHNSDVCINESRPYYGKALRLLNKAIMDKEKGMSNTTLCATMLLSFYEMFASDNDASWVRHAGGASTLMRMRGPERHRIGFDREIFLSYRHTLLIEAFSNDTASFLNDPEWRQLSTDIHDDVRKENSIPPDRIELFEAVEDFNQHLAKMTAVGADAHRLYESLQNSESYINSEWYVTYEALKDAHAELKRIFSTFTAALASINLLPTSTKTSDPIIPTNYTYPNVFVSVKYVGHWTTLMVCNIHILRLGSKLMTITPDMKMELATYEQECIDFSLESCRSINYMLKSSFLGPFFAVFALRLASRTFPLGSSEWNWTIAKLYRIGERHMQFAKHVPQFDRMGSESSELREAVLRVKQKLAKARGDRLAA